MGAVFALGGMKDGAERGKCGGPRWFGVWGWAFDRSVGGKEMSQGKVSVLEPEVKLMR